MPFVCVQPLLMSWARRSEDLTFDTTDEKDAVIIARLAVQLRCYVPEPVDQTWGRLRHLGARREQLLVEAGRQVQQIRALLECVWPAALSTARQPFRSSTWTAAMSVVFGRDASDLARTHRLGLARLESAVRRVLHTADGGAWAAPVARSGGDRALIVHAATEQEPTTGRFLFLLVLGILLGTFAVVLIANIGEHRDRHSRRLMNQRAPFGLDKVFGSPSLRYITAWQVVSGVLFLSFALFMIFSAIANLA